MTASNISWNWIFCVIKLYLKPALYPKSLPPVNRVAKQLHCFSVLLTDVAVSDGIICLVALLSAQVFLFPSPTVSAPVFCIRGCKCDDNTLLLSGSSTRVIISKMEFFSQTVMKEQTRRAVEPSHVGSYLSHEWNAFLLVVQ